ncbi:MAG: sugar transferase, partial [Dehalococcoidia bacterium]
MEQVSERRTAQRPLAVGKSFYDVTKRGVDLVGSLFLLILLAPVLLVVALVIGADSGPPIIYKCQRLGRGGRAMTAYKFRTMFDGSHHHLEEMLSIDEER